MRNDDLRIITVKSVPWNAKPGPLVATCLMSIPLSQLINPRKAKTAKPAKKLKNKIIRIARTDGAVENPPH